MLRTAALIVRHYYGNYGYSSITAKGYSSVYL